MPRKREHPFCIISGGWYGYAVIGGKRRLLSLGLPAGARPDTLGCPEVGVTLARTLERLLAQRVAEWRETVQRMPVDKAISWALSDCRDLSPRTVILYRTEGDSFAAWLLARGLQHIDDLRPRHLVEYRQHLRIDRCRREAGINAALRVVRRLLTSLRRGGYLPADYASADWFQDAFYTSPPSRDTTRVLSSMEIRAVCADEWYGPLYRWLLATGQRVGSVLALHASHIDRERRLVIYPPSKRDRRHQQQITAQMAALLDELPQTGYLFWRTDLWGEPTARAIANRQGHVIRRLNRALHRAGYQPATVHSLRHTATTLLAATMEAAALRAFIGHEDIQTTMKYTHLAPHSFDVPEIPGIPMNAKGTQKKKSTGRN